MLYVWLIVLTYINFVLLSRCSSLERSIREVSIKTNSTIKGIQREANRNIDFMLETDRILDSHLKKNEA